MKTLYVRNVPEDVSERLDRLAVSAGMSVSAFVVRELADVARRADNPALLGLLPDLAVPVDTVLAELDAARRQR